MSADLFNIDILEALVNPAGKGKKGEILGEGALEGTGVVGEFADIRLLFAPQRYFKMLEKGGYIEVGGMDSFGKKAYKITKKGLEYLEDYDKNRQ